MTCHPSGKSRSMNSRVRITAAGMTMLLAAACASDAPSDQHAADSSEDLAEPVAAPAALPVSEPDGPPAAASAALGQELFGTRGCVACHYVGQTTRLVGPDLLGVTNRRSFDWFYRMVTQPDSMLREDEEARKLLGQYMTPMTDMNVQPDEVVAIWDYLRRAQAEAAGGS